jgi:hypothetical protein
MVDPPLIPHSARDYFTEYSSRFGSFATVYQDHFFFQASYQPARRLTGKLYLKTGLFRGGPCHYARHQGPAGRQDLHESGDIPPIKNLRTMYHQDGFFGSQNFLSSVYLPLSLHVDTADRQSDSRRCYRCNRGIILLPDVPDIGCAAKRLYIDVP